MLSVRPTTSSRGCRSAKTPAVSCCSASGGSAGRSDSFCPLTAPPVFLAFSPMPSAIMGPEPSVSKVVTGTGGTVWPWGVALGFAVAVVGRGDNQERKKRRFLFPFAVFPGPGWKKTQAAASPPHAYTGCECSRLRPAPLETFASINQHQPAAATTNLTCCRNIFLVAAAADNGWALCRENVPFSIFFCSGCTVA